MSRPVIEVRDLRQASRPARRTSFTIVPDHQSQDGEDTRADVPTGRAGAGGRAHSVIDRRALGGLDAGRCRVPAVACGKPAGKVHRVGLLTPVAFDSDSAELAAFRGRLAALGYVEGQNLAIVIRDAGGQYDRLPEVAAELVRLKV